MSMFPHTSIAIIGAGITGLSTTAALIRRGIDVQCFETVHAGAGQSGGGSRILRCAYDDPEMLSFAGRAVAGWRRWEAELGRPLVDRDGSFLIVDDCAAELARLRSLGVDAVMADPAKQRELLPIRRPWAQSIIHERDAGTIHAADTMGWLRTVCGRHLHEESEVIGLTERSDHVLITTRKAIWQADRVLVCGGIATPTIASWMGVDIRQVHSVHQRLLFPIKPEFRHQRLLSFRDKTDHRNGVLYTYGLRALHRDHFAIGLEPADVERIGGGHPDIVVEHTLDLARELFPGLDLERPIIDSCVSTALAPPPGDQPWESERLIVVRHGRCDFFAGGHLFKFAPALGEALATVAIGQEIPPLFKPR